MPHNDAVLPGSGICPALNARSAGVHPVDRRRRGAPAHGQPPPHHRPVRSVRHGGRIIQIAVGNDVQWRAVAVATGIDVADPRFATARSRVQHRAELTVALEDRLRERCSSDWLARFAAVGVPSGKVRTLDEVYTWNQTDSVARQAH